MYNIRTLIQEIQLLRGSFRIYVLIAHGSAPLGTGAKTRQLGWWRQSTRTTVGGVLWSVPGSHHLSGPEWPLHCRVEPCFKKKPDLTFLTKLPLPARILFVRG